MRIGVCSSADKENTEGLVKDPRWRSPDESTEIQYIKLPYSKLDEFPLEEILRENGINLLILCHSIVNRGISLTNVQNALYDKFIQRASRTVGKNALVVIAHDFKWPVDDDESRSAQEESFKVRQPDIYKYAGTVLLAGKLETAGNVGVHEQDWRTLEDVVMDCILRERDREQTSERPDTNTGGKQNKMRQRFKWLRIALGVGAVVIIAIIVMQKCK